MMVSMGVISALHSFRTLPCMLSGPCALLTFMLLSSLSTPFSEIVMSGISRKGLGPLSGTGTFDGGVKAF